MKDVYHQLLTKAWINEPFAEEISTNSKIQVEPITPSELGLPIKTSKEIAMRNSYPWYSVDVSSYSRIDIYRVLMLFKVTDPPLQHAIKKLLVAGKRAGGKDKIQDIQESIDALNRMLEILREDEI